MVHLQGKLLYQQSRERLFQFSWRPRLPSLLPPDREAEIQKNLKSYSKRCVALLVHISHAALDASNSNTEGHLADGPVCKRLGLLK
jgi:hypothetical protein